MTERPHLEWLVPARSRIQDQLLRLHLVGEKHPDVLGAGSANWSLAGWLLGASFSLWRAVFQAERGLDKKQNQIAAKTFLTKLIEDNAIMYSDEKNSWSYGYYVGNARFRIGRMFEELPLSERTPDVIDIVNRNTMPSGTVENDSQAAWNDAFDGVRVFIDILERRVSRESSML